MSCFLNRTNSIRNLGGLVIQKIKASPVISGYQRFTKQKRINKWLPLIKFMLRPLYHPLKNPSFLSTYAKVPMTDVYKFFCAPIWKTNLQIKSYFYIWASCKYNQTLLQVKLQLWTNPICSFNRCMCNEHFYNLLNTELSKFYLNRCLHSSSDNVKGIGSRLAKKPGYGSRKHSLNWAWIWGLRS